MVRFLSGVAVVLAIVDATVADNTSNTSVYSNSTTATTASPTANATTTEGHEACSESVCSTKDYLKVLPTRDGAVCNAAICTQPECCYVHGGLAEAASAGDTTVKLVSVDGIEDCVMAMLVTTNASQFVVKSVDKDTNTLTLAKPLEADHEKGAVLGVMLPSEGVIVDCENGTVKGEYFDDDAAVETRVVVAFGAALSFIFLS